MALIDDVRAVCRRLGPHGWADLLLQHGLDITARNLAEELRKELPGVRRNVPGFEDFAMEGNRGIEPGRPARSLLFHALASPNVLKGVDNNHLGAFPTLAEIDVVENYVFGAKPPTLQELKERVDRAPLAVAVFASEYRTAMHTSHRKHADLVFARTGVARVGTAEPLYDSERRGFVPFVDGEPFAIRVSPSRFAAYVAVQKSGDGATFRPMNFRAGDDGRLFWLPLHKLFSGTECLRDLNGGEDLQVTLTTRHVNEKIRGVSTSSCASTADLMASRMTLASTSPTSPTRRFGSPRALLRWAKRPLSGRESWYRPCILGLSSQPSTRASRSPSMCRAADRPCRQA